MKKNVVIHWLGLDGENLAKLVIAEYWFYTPGEICIIILFFWVKLEG